MDFHRIAVPCWALENPFFFKKGVDLISHPQYLVEYILPVQQEPQAHRGFATSPENHRGRTSSMRLPGFTQVFADINGFRICFKYFMNPLSKTFPSWVWTLILNPL